MATPQTFLDLFIPLGPGTGLTPDLWIPIYTGHGITIGISGGDVSNAGMWWTSSAPLVGWSNWILGSGFEDGTASLIHGDASVGWVLGEVDPALVVPLYLPAIGESGTPLTHHKRHAGDILGARTIASMTYTPPWPFELLLHQLDNLAAPGDSRSFVYHNAGSAAAEQWEYAGGTWYITGTDPGDKQGVTSAYSAFGRALSILKYHNIPYSEFTDGSGQSVAQAILSAENGAQFRCAVNLVGGGWEPVTITDPAIPLDPPPVDPAVATTGLVLISEIMFSLPSISNQESTRDWIELVNMHATPVNIGGWYLDDEDLNPTYIPEGTVLQPGETCIVTNRNAAQFRVAWGLPETAQVYDTDWLLDTNPDDGDSFNESFAIDPSPTNDNPEILSLFDASGNLISRANYFNGSNGWPLLGELQQYGHPPSIYLPASALIAAAQSGDPEFTSDPTLWRVSTIGVDGAIYADNAAAGKSDFFWDWSVEVGSPGHVEGIGQNAAQATGALALVLTLGSGASLVLSTGGGA